ncbi:MAG: hypothetical protein BWY35_00915 [Firmicutes bacterium ADurb.Bin248]|nr:MAG: hypothetical protein BWY35_00915 [Firmicutes bacterium ADurb.Bin248]
MSGHGEGWALYAERLMAELGWLDDAGNRMGMLDAQRFRAARVVIERAQPMPGQGVTSTFSTGMGYGIWIGLLGALEIPYSSVRPCEWTRRLLKGVPGEGKARSILLASQTFPGIELVPPGCRKPRDGRADAACLAYYGLTA